MIAPIDSGHQLDHCLIEGVAARNGMASILRAKDLRTGEPLPADLNMSSFVSGDIAVDFAPRQVTVGSRTVHLGPKEFDLLKYLTAHNERTSSTFHALWGPNRGSQIDNLRVVINQLRKKIETDPAHPGFIATERSVGYRFQASKDNRESTRKVTENVDLQATKIAPALDERAVQLATAVPTGRQCVY